MVSDSIEAMADIPSIGPGGAASSAKRLTFGSTPPELVGQRLAIDGEFERARVDAIALAGRRRAVGEDVALVRAAAGADDLVLTIP